MPEILPVLFPANPIAAYIDYAFEASADFELRAAEEEETATFCAL